MSKRTLGSFGSAGKLNKKDDTDTSTEVSTNNSTEVSTNNSTEEVKAGATSTSPSPSQVNSMESLKRKMAAKKKPQKKKQISTYLEPAVYEAYQNHFDRDDLYKGEKAEFINDLLKEFFGID